MKSTMSDETAIKNNAPKAKRQRRIGVKNPSLFLFKKRNDGLADYIGSYETISRIQEAYEKALDEGNHIEELFGIKGRFLEFKITEAKRKIRIK